jgi:tyrosyl-tRNA synthetase
MTVEEVLEQCTAHELVDLMVEIGWTKSKGEGRRLITQGGIRINDIKVTDTNTYVFVTPDRKQFYLMGIDGSKAHG